MIKSKLLVLVLIFGCLRATSLLGIDSTARLKLKQTSISDRDLLGVASRWQQKTGRKLLDVFHKLPIAEIDTVKLNILAIRVEFQEDNDEASTGNGKFDLSPRKQIMIDPTPHNKPYFEAQLQALSNYYRSVSRGKLILTGLNNQFGDVYPLDVNKAWQLPHDMVYYGTDESETLRDQRLVQLFQDAWMVADKDAEIDFSRYDCFIVFHAGVGGDLAFDFDETPYDISSAFLNFADLKETLGNGDVSYRGIPVQNGSVFIRDGIILPETQSQNKVEFGLLGTETLMFGSQIGLPSLFNTETGRAGIGKWGLMDQGSGNFTGLIPAQPCAWSKVFLGWEKPVVLTSGESIPVAAALAKKAHKIYKIPINTKEYFLIENRQQHLLKTPDLAVAHDQQGVRVELKRDGTMTQRVSDDTFRVLVSVDEYDFDCPGSGILIWHIDESVIEENYPTNRVNNNPNHRGVDLEEAHGSQDIGGNYGYLHPAYGCENGIAENAFWNGNESNKTVNASKTVAFTPTSNPGSWSYTRANSHIYITNFSKIDSIMSFDLKIDLYQKGFPRNIGRAVQWTPNSLLAHDLNNDNLQEILAASTDGKIYGWKFDGSPIIQSNYTVTHLDLQGRSINDTVALFASAADSILLAPTVTDFNADGIFEVAAVTKSGAVYKWLPVDQNSDGAADLLENFPLNLNASPTALLSNREDLVVGLSTGELAAIGSTGVLWRKSIFAQAVQGLAFYQIESVYFVTSTSGDLAKVDANGTVVWQKSFGAEAGQPCLGDIDRDGKLNIIVPFSNSVVKILDDAGIQIHEIRLPVQKSLVECSLADINRDGLLEIVTVADDQLWIYYSSGVLFENFPAALVWNTQLSGFDFALPAMGDLDNDAKSELVLGSLNGEILAFHQDAQKADNFPLSTANAVLSTPLLTDLDRDQKVELAAISSDNSLYVWKMDGEFNELNIPWSGHRGNSMRWAYVTTPNQPVVKEGDLLTSAYNYPNPTEGNSTTIRYELTAASKVKIKIYDLAGELIDELVGPENVATPNEIIWNLSGIESGVYFARIVAESSEKGRTAEKIIKIAVVK